jgi:hypothetical protein
MTSLRLVRQSATGYLASVLVVILCGVWLGQRSALAGCEKNCAPGIAPARRERTPRVAHSKRVLSSLAEIFFHSVRVALSHAVWIITWILVAPRTTVQNMRTRHVHAIRCNG